jgi:hypothetical protein
MNVESNFVMLRFDGVNLAFPRGDVLTVESFSKVQQDESLVPAMGTLTWEEQELPVYVLSRNFDLLQDPQQRRFCVCFVMPNLSERYVLACDTVEQYALPSDTAVQALPEFMRMPHSPVCSMFREGDNLALLSTAASMQGFVAAEESKDG